MPAGAADAEGCSEVELAPLQEEELRHYVRSLVKELEANVLLAGAPAVATGFPHTPGGAVARAAAAAAPEAACPPSPRKARCRPLPGRRSRRGSAPTAGVAAGQVSLPPVGAGGQESRAGSKDSGTSALFMAPSKSKDSLVSGASSTSALSHTVCCLSFGDSCSESSHPPLNSASGGPGRNSKAAGGLVSRYRRFVFL